MPKIGQTSKVKLSSRLSLSTLTSRPDSMQIRDSDARVDLRRASVAGYSKVAPFSCSVFLVLCTSNSLTLTQIAYSPQFPLQELFYNVETSENLPLFVD